MIIYFNGAVLGDIFSALESGIDVFDSSCVYSATERGCAMVFPVGHQPCDSYQVSSGPESEGERGGKANNEVAEVQPFEIDLNEER